MAIILDTEGMAERTYRSHIQRAVFAGLARLFPQKRFLGTLPVDYQNIMPERAAGPLPAQKGLFYAKKTVGWLQQHDAEVFISCRRMLKTAHPLQQILVLLDEEQLADEKTIALASAIAVVSEGLRRLFIEKYPGYESRLFLLEGAAGQETPDRIMITDDIREIIASGREYFIIADFNLSLDKLTTLLKGFSTFKRMLHSSWKLMIVLRSEEEIKKTEAAQLLSNYKYREDIILTDEDRLHEKIRDAYVLVTMDESERLAIPVMEAIRATTPAIAPETCTVREIGGDALAYFASQTSDAVGEMLMKMYKEENFRRNLLVKQENIRLPQFPEGLDNLMKEVLRLPADG